MVTIIIVGLIIIVLYMTIIFSVFKANSIDDRPSCDSCPFREDEDYCPCDKFFNYKENDK